MAIRDDAAIDLMQFGILSDRNLRYPFAKRGPDDHTTRMELPDDIHYKRANTFPTCDIDVLAQVKYITI